MTILHKAIYRLNANPIKLPMSIFTKLEQKNLKICIGHKELEDAKQSWEKNRA